MFQPELRQRTRRVTRLTRVSLVVSLGVTRLVGSVQGFVVMLTVRLPTLLVLRESL